MAGAGAADGENPVQVLNPPAGSHQPPFPFCHWSHPHAKPGGGYAATAQQTRSLVGRPSPGHFFGGASHVVRPSLGT